MSSTPITLLIVDDNHAMCNILRDYFQMTDQVTLCDIAFNGEDALEKIRVHQPDVVLLDIIMPQLDGLSVLEKLNEDPPQKRPAIIVASALGQEMITNRALQLGANYYLIKPYQLQNLLDRILMIAKSDDTFTEPPEVEVNLNTAITRHLIATGMSTHIVGYRYCVQAIELMLTETVYCPLMKFIYPEVARKNETTVSCVESAIRKAIGTAHEEELRQLSNRNFLSRMAEQIKLKYQL